MAMLELTMPLYENQDTDEYYLPKPGPGEVQADIKPVNLNAIRYYASTGMKPLRIGILVGVHYNTIWRNQKMRLAYEEGAAYHELWLRSVALEATKTKPSIALDLLNRSNGVPDFDFNQGLPEDERVDTSVEFSVKIPTFNHKKLTDSERAELDGENES